MNRFTPEYWTERYQNNQTGWDAGSPTRPFVELFEQLTDKNLRILIPGCGHAYEGELLHKLGFKNITLLDGSEVAREQFLARVPTFSAEHYTVQDFFAHQGEYDLILEQTFFCALEPKLRPKYAKKMHQLLATEGKLMGVLFKFPLTESGPPFGGSVTEYEKYFNPFFEIVKMEECKNSIEPRLGNELFIEFKKAVN